MKRSGNNLSSSSSVSGSNNIGNRKPFNKVNVPKPVNLPIVGSTGTITASTATTNTTLNSNNNNTTTNTTPGSLSGNNNSTTSTLNNANSTSNTPGNAWNTRQLQSSWFQNNSQSSSNVDSSSADPNNVSQFDNNKPTTINTTPSLPVRSTRTPITPTKETNNNNNTNNNSPLALTPQPSNSINEEIIQHEKKQIIAATHAGHDSNWGEIYDDDDDFYDSDLEELIEKENKTNAPQVKTKKQKYLEKKKLLREQQMNAEKSNKPENSEPKTVSTPSNNSNSPSQTSSPQNSLPSSPPCLNTTTEQSEQIEQTEQTEELEELEEIEEIEETEQIVETEPENPASPPESSEIKLPKHPEPHTTIPPKNTPVTSHRPPSFFSIGRPVPNAKFPPSAHSLHTTDNHVPKIIPEPHDNTKPKEEIIKTIKEQEVLLNETAERRRKEKQDEEDRIERERKEKALSKLKELEKKLAEKKPPIPEPVAQPLENVQPAVETSTNSDANSNQQNFNSVKILKSHNNGGSTRGNHHNGRGGSTHKTQRPANEQPPKVQHQEKEDKSITDADNNWRNSNVKLTNPFVESFQVKKRPESSTHPNQPTSEPVANGSTETTHASTTGAPPHHNSSGRGGHTHSTRGRPNTRGGHTHRNPRKPVDNENAETVQKPIETNNSAIDFSNVLKNINPNEAKNKISFGMFDDEPKLPVSQPATTHPEHAANPRPERPHTGAKHQSQQREYHKRSNNQNQQQSTESAPNTTTTRQPNQSKPPRQKQNLHNNENQTHPRPRRNQEFVKTASNEVKIVPADSAPEQTQQKEIYPNQQASTEQTSETQRMNGSQRHRRGNHHNGTPRNNNHHEKHNAPKSRICFVKVDNTTSQE